MASLGHNELIRWGLNNMVTLLHNNLSNVWSDMVIFPFWLKFKWNVFLMFSLLISQHWFAYDFLSSNNEAIWTEPMLTKFLDAIYGVARFQRVDTPSPATRRWSSATSKTAFGCNGISDDQDLAPCGGNADLLPTRPSDTNFTEILIKLFW